MEARYLLDITDDTRDRFFYEILPVNIVNKIPIYRNPVTLVRNVVHNRELESTHAPNCIESQAGFKFYNRSCEKLFGTEETNKIPVI